MAFIPQNARAYSFCGTIEYMAPEIVKGGSQGHDMVSFGFSSLSSAFGTVLSIHRMGRGQK